MAETLFSPRPSSAWSAGRRAHSSGSTLFLDAGSTLLAVAAQLKGPLTVILASLDIAQLFSDRADIQLILLGGQWDSKQRLFAGSATWRWSPATGPISPFSAPARSMPGWG